MSPVAVIAWILGTFAVGAGLLTVGVPDVVRKGMNNFPRSVWPGRVLLAVDMAWAAYAVTQMHLGMFDAWKVHLYWLAPVCILLGSLYLDELLSVRALGGLLLLAAGPMLISARFHPSAWRYVIIVMAYLWIAAGLFFLLEPWWFRRMTWPVRSNMALRVGGAIKALIGLGLIALALLVY